MEDKVIADFRKKTDMNFHLLDGMTAGEIECSKNIIDSYTQPFYGLVKFAREEPETVQQMFMDLYSDDGGNVKISDFCSSLYNLNFKTNLLTPI